MRPEPKYTVAASADVGSTVRHYDDQRANLGTEFLDELERVTLHIRNSPLLSTLVDAPVRRVLLRRFPFGVFFISGSSTEADVIVAVLDLRQDPEAIRQAYER